MKKSIQRKLLDISQILLNRAYSRKGLNDDILDLQVKINTLRNKLDIPDKNEIVNDEGFVQ